MKHLSDKQLEHSKNHSSASFSVHKRQLKVLSRRESYPINRVTYQQQCTIYRIAHVSWDCNSTNHQTHPDFATLRILVSGCINIATGSHTLGQAHPGDVIIHPKHTPYTLTVSDEQPAELWILALHDPQHHIQRAQFYSSPIRHELEALCETIFACCEQQGHYQPYLDLLLQRINTQPNNRPAQLELAINLLHEGLSIQSVAERLEISRSTLHRWCLRHCGMSAQHIQLHRRLESAAQQLADSSSSIADIAEGIGYECQFAFSKAFKRHFGISPSACRKL